jgi:Asp-tRNA(Asn)/Glu-tRNA(Gln) amidotransferase A subunit family amidase
LKHKVLSETGSTRGTAYTMSNKIVTHDRKTHVVWLDQINKTYIRTYHDRSKRWGKPVLVGEGDDNHAGASLAIDSAGYLHLVFGPHHNPIQHLVSKRPNTSTAWEAQPKLGGVTATYPSLVCDHEDTLHICYRGAYEREMPRSLMYQRRPKGGEWTSPVKLLDAEGPEAYTQFENALYFGPDRSLFLSFHIVRAREDDHAHTRGMGFGVMRSADGGESWESMDGQQVSLPATPESPCVIEFDEALDVRMGNLVSDNAGNAYFTLNRRERDVHETVLYRWRKGGWEEISLLPEAQALFGDCQMSDVCALSMGVRQVLYAAGVVCNSGGGWADPTNEIVLFTSRDKGDTVSTYKVSPCEPGISNWLPSLERSTGHNQVWYPHLLYTHGEVGVGCSPDIDTQIRCVPTTPIGLEQNQAVRDALAGTISLSGLKFPEQVSSQVWRRIERSRGHYENLRDVDVGYDVEPPTVFRPGTVGEGVGGEEGFAWLTSGKVTKPSVADELAFLPVSQLAKLIESRQISPVELTRLYLDRLTTYGPNLNCVVTLTEELALEQAEAAEKAIARGDYKGPLHGIPWGAKDLLSTRGIPTTWGATPFEHQVIDRDSTVGVRLREAGAVLVAKLSLGALASGHNWFRGMTRNPWNTEKGSSGSSAGPGSATAAGLVGFSIGSETQGSIVSPSATCGVVGLRPTYGRVSRYGAMALCWTMDKLGPMCRSVEDCAAVLATIYGPDGKDHSVADVPFGWPSGKDLDDLRVGYLVKDFEDVNADDDRAVNESALGEIRALGIDPKPVELPDYPSVADIVLPVEAASAFDDLTRSGEIDSMSERDKSNWPEALRIARTIPAVEYLRAQRVRSMMMREMEALMNEWDVLIGPPLVGSNGRVTNLTGNPAVTLPCGFVDGSPRGITFFGGLYDEATVLRTALAFEQSTKWHTQHPELSVSGD